jgi:putative tricarboxylic transport membrane protein
MRSGSEQVSSAILVLFGAFIAFYSYKYLKLGMLIQPGAGFIPFYVGVALALLGAIWLIIALVGSKASTGVAAEACAEEEVDHSQGNLILTRLLPGILAVVLYAWLFERAGYLVSTLIFMFGWQKIVERQGWLKTVVVSVVSAGAMYALFAYLLRVSLPSGSWLS